MTYKKIFRNRFYNIYDIPRRWNIFLLNGVAASVFTPPSPSENGRFGVYHRGQNRYHDST